MNKNEQNQEDIIKDDTFEELWDDYVNSITLPEEQSDVFYTPESYNA